MLGILKNNIPRDILRNRNIYLLMALLIAIGMYIASTLASVTYSTKVVCEENYITSNYQDGQFSLRKPLTEPAEDRLQQKGYTTERIFSFDREMENGSILRFFKVRNKIDLLVLDEGSYPVQSGELVIDKCYAAAYGLSAGDTIHIASRAFRITGLGSVTDYDMPARNISDYSSNSELFGLAFLTNEDYAALLSELGSETRQDFVYSYKLAEGLTDDDLRKELLNIGDHNDAVLTFVPRANNARMCRAIIDGYAYELGGDILGIGLVVLVSVVFYLGIKTSIERESASIGALYAMGVKKHEVILMYLAPSTLIALIAGCAGWTASIWFSAATIISPSNYYCIPRVPVIASPFSIPYCILMPPVICFLINWVRLNKTLSMSPVSLLKGTFDTGIPRHRNPGRAHRIMFDLICSQFIKDKGLFLILMTGSLVAGLIYMLGTGLDQYLVNIMDRLPAEINYEYVYDLLDDTDVPSDTGESVYKKVFKINNMDYVADVPFIGLESPSEFFPVNTENLDGKVIISNALASRYGLKENDELNVFDEVTGKEYAFTVASITDYRVMYTAYMNIDDLRERLGKERVYNSVYSNEAGDYKPAELLGAYRKEDFIRPAESLEPESKRMSIFLYIVATVFYMAVVAFIVRFSVSASQRQIAIFSVLGYSYRELKTIFLSSTAVFSAVCGAVGLIAGFHLSKLAVPYLLGTTAVGVFLYYSVTAFIRDFLLVLIIYVLSAGFTLNQIKKINELDYVSANE